MLRALASYLFGEIENEAPEAPIECETREVNDWLVVNLPDQNQKSINLNDEYDIYDENNDGLPMYEINDEDVTKEMDEDDPVEVDASEIDLEEDDVLLSVSFLMMSQEAEPISSEYSIYDSNALSLYESGMFPFQPMAVEFFEVISPKADEEFLKDVKQYLPSHLIEPSNCMKMSRFQRSGFLEMLRNRTRRYDIVNEYERKFRASLLTPPTRDIITPPVHSKNYVNHRHPDKLINQDLLQRIKELEPEQQAVQRSVKKNFTRAQFNRQNKNFMYETSSKKNRRSNRQRNPSGANNNRKC